MQNLINVKCLNPNCNNKFDIYKSSYDDKRKLYCCRKCRSEHHWMTTPLFEKKCFNPFCNVIIKRKFKQKIDGIKYCSSICRKNHKYQIFQEKLKDTIKSNCSVCNKELINKREPCGKLVPRKTCDECTKKISGRTASNATSKFKFLYKNDKNFYNKMRKIHKENGKKYKEKIKKFGLFPKWIEWYKNFSKLGQSKTENKVVDYLKSKASKVERSYQISNMFVDIYVPDKNLIIECFGDYWHMNPLKYKPANFNTSTKRTAKEQWEKDKRRRLFMESNGYKVVELWESEINNGDYKKLDIYM